MFGNVIHKKDIVMTVSLMEMLHINISLVLHQLLRRETLLQHQLSMLQMQFVQTLM